MMEGEWISLVGGVCAHLPGTMNMHRASFRLFFLFSYDEGEDERRCSGETLEKWIHRR